MMRISAMVAGLVFWPASLAAAAPPGVSTLHEESRGRALHFWPRQINPDASTLVYVQLPMPQVDVEGVVECGSYIYELGSPVWSHPFGLLHAFDLEWTLPRVRAACQLKVRCYRGELVVAEYPLVIWPYSRPPLIRGVAPQALRADEEALVELWGVGFSEVVDITWVSAVQPVRVRQSGRLQGEGGGGRVVLRFSPVVAGAPVGEYLVVAENQDNTGAISLESFFVTPPPSPELVKTVVEGVGDRTWLVVEGFDLESIESTTISFASGTLPLIHSFWEGNVIPALRVELPPGMDATHLNLAGVWVEGTSLLIRVGTPNPAAAPTAEK